MPHLPPSQPQYRYPHAALAARNFTAKRPAPAHVPNNPTKLLPTFTTYTAIRNLPRYPNIHPTAREHNRLFEDGGLATPITLLPNGEIHPRDRLIFEAFVRLAEFYGPNGTAIIPTCTTTNSLSTK